MPRIKQRPGDIVAIDIGALSVKAQTAVTSGVRSIVFPSRIALGVMQSSARNVERVEVVLDNTVTRVGDISQRSGFVDWEVTRALSMDAVVAVFVKAALQKLSVKNPSMILLTSSVKQVVDFIETNEGTACKIAEQIFSYNKVKQPCRIGFVPLRLALVARRSVDIAGRHLDLHDQDAIIDLGTSGWRCVAGVDLSVAVTRFSNFSIGCGVEKAICSIVEDRLGTPVVGVFETLRDRRHRTRSRFRDIGEIIDVGIEQWVSNNSDNIEAWLRSSLEGVKRVQLVGGFSVLLGRHIERMITGKVVEVSNGCEMGAVNGVMRALKHLTAIEGQRHE
jgi:hypothetical protein